MTYKETVDQFFKLKHTFILECAMNDLKLVKRADLKRELMTYAYMYILEKEEKIYDKVMLSGGLESIVVNYMYKQIKWNNTKFKKDFIYPSKYNSTKPIEELENYLEDDTMDEEFWLEKEKDHQDKLNHIYSTIATSALDQRLLYKAIFIDGYNTSGKLAKHIGMSRSMCYTMIKQFKEKIKNSYPNINLD